MEIDDLLLDAFGRVRDGVPAVLDGLSDDDLANRPDGRGNSIAWLVWHLSRVQDDHLADAAGAEQVWHAQPWRQRFALPLADDDTGYGHDSGQVARVRASADLLAGYHRAVADRTIEFVTGLRPEDLDRVVDESWSPPVTLGVRLISVVDDCLEHLGQAAYLRGLLAG